MHFITVQTGIVVWEIKGQINAGRSKNPSEKNRMGSRMGSANNKFGRKRYNPATDPTCTSDGNFRTPGKK